MGDSANENIASTGQDIRPVEQREMVHHDTHVSGNYTVNNYYYNNKSYSGVESIWTPPHGPEILQAYVQAAPETAQRVLGIIEQEQKFERKAEQSGRWSATAGFIFSIAVVIGLAVLAVAVSADSSDSGSRWTTLVVGIISGAAAPAAISVVTRTWLRTRGSVAGKNSGNHGGRVR
jgi:uncharacterized membrane protein